MSNPMLLTFINLIISALLEHFKSEVLNSVFTHGPGKRTFIRWIFDGVEVTCFTLAWLDRLANIDFVIHQIADYVDVPHTQ